jgi:imidazolonepropionase-like amidohydrolase
MPIIYQLEKLIMKYRFLSMVAFLMIALALLSYRQTRRAKYADTILFKNIRLIDGNGNPAVEQTDMLVEGDLITVIAPHQSVAGAEVIDLQGKTIIPCLISTHVHIGTLQGLSNAAEHYTRDNILAQLKKYQDYGICNILVMGSDRPVLFESGLRDSSLNGLLPGARIHTAGYGFGTPGGGPPVGFGFDQIYRPSNAGQVVADMDSLATLKPDLVKLWLDDFGGQFKKMDPAIYKTIIAEAHKHSLRVAAHVYYLGDGRRLVADGVDIFAHSIRDSLIDDALVRDMKAKHVIYIPTLSLDEFAYIYARKPDWIDDAFFRASLEPGVYDMITSEKYQNDLRNSASYTRNIHGFEIALKNLKKLYDAGILISLGTDSGAMPIRAQGFSEHLELELMVQAGLTPMQAISVATKNASQLLKINKNYGTLEKGKIADFIILDGNPLTDIKNTRKIVAVYKAGKQVSKGPA